MEVVFSSADKYSPYNFIKSFKAIVLSLLYWFKIEELG
tara:strand:+ start:1055 stop:1168 length:114 start_codon:yes stop_codon:yes gene_type:complete